MPIKFVGKKVAKEKFQELGLGLKRMLKIKKVDGDIYQFAFASYSKKNAESVADTIKKGAGRPTEIIKSGSVYEVYEFWGAKRKPKPMRQQVLLRTVPKTLRITPKRPRLRR